MDSNRMGFDGQISKTGRRSWKYKQKFMYLNDAGTVNVTRHVSKHTTRHAALERAKRLRGTATHQLTIQVQGLGMIEI